MIIPSKLIILKFVHLDKKVIIEPNEGALKREEMLWLLEALCGKGSSCKGANVFLVISQVLRSTIPFERRLGKEMVASHKAMMVVAETYTQKTLDNRRN